MTAAPWAPMIAPPLPAPHGDRPQCPHGYDQVDCTGDGWHALGWTTAGDLAT